MDLLKIFIFKEEGMKIFISVDLEGISGLVSWDQMTGNSPEYAKAVDLMLKEVNAAVEGAIKGGANEVVVNDSHGYMKNLPAEGLHPNASLVSGDLKPLSMVQGVEGSDLVFFIGYHAGVGTKAGICDHTYSSKSVFQLKFNGQAFSETAINAAVCGHYGVPVGLVTGDLETVNQAKALLPDALTVITKTGISRFAAYLRHPQEVRTEIASKAQMAVKEAQRFQPFRIQTPVVMEITFVHSAKADLVELVPGTERVDSRTIQFKGENVLEVYRALQVFLILAQSIT
jgi:D-amino peptidase